jgi:hypothetical protein
MHPEEPGDTYLHDGISYRLTVELRAIVTEPMHSSVGRGGHALHGEWWWANAVPPDVVLEGDRRLIKIQADEIEEEMRQLENDMDVTKHELRLFMQLPMPCGHAVGNLLTCPTPPFGCVICGEAL